MGKVWVYTELDQSRPRAIALELLALGRELGDVEAVALGPGAREAAAQLGAHGARRVLVNEDPAFGEYLAEPATDCLAALAGGERPDLILFGFSSDSREVAGRPPPLKAWLSVPLGVVTLAERFPERRSDAAAGSREMVDHVGERAGSTDGSAGANGVGLPARSRRQPDRGGLLPARRRLARPLSGSTIDRSHAPALAEARLCADPPSFRECNR